MDSRGQSRRAGTPTEHETLTVRSTLQGSHELAGNRLPLQGSGVRVVTIRWRRPPARRGTCHRLLSSRLSAWNFQSFWSGFRYHVATTLASLAGKALLWATPRAVSLATHNG
jgi:hypothetical protein